MYKQIKKCKSVRSSTQSPSDLLKFSIQRIILPWYSLYKADCKKDFFLTRRQRLKAYVPRYNTKIAASLRQNAFLTS